MKISVISFTEKGMQLSRRLAEAFQEKKNISEYEIELWAKYKSFDEKASASEGFVVNEVENSIYEWAFTRNKEHTAMLFIGAMGIAIRAIAPIVKDKLEDVPVIVMDELGIHVIPVLSGHMGGANELALLIADCVGAEPVITTATDIEGVFSVDLFAKENNLAIMNREGIAKVSTKALEGKSIHLAIENFPSESADVIISDTIPVMTTSEKFIENGKNVYSVNENIANQPSVNNHKYENTDSLILCPRKYAVGIGCRRGTDAGKLYDFLCNNIEKLGIDKKQIGGIGSIDLKADEPCLIDLGKRLCVPFITFTTEILEKAKGEYTESVFVKEKTGIGNVCERAAMVLSNNRGEFVLRKTSGEGMTIAIVKCE